MPYQGLIYAAVLGFAFAVGIGMLIAGTQWEEPQTYTTENRRRRGEYNNRRPEPEETRTYDTENRRRRGGYNNRSEPEGSSHRGPKGYNRRGSKNDQQTTCPICFENFFDAFQAIRSLSCKHKYHASCIQKWFREQRANRADLCCPMCRQLQ